MGLYVDDITFLDDAKQTFTANIRLILRWVDSRLETKEVKIKRYKFGEIWDPLLRVANGRNLYQELEKIDGIIPQQRLDFATLQPYYMAMFRVDPAVHPTLNRDDIVDALVAEGIPAYKNYRSIYKTEAFWQPPAPHGDKNFWINRCPNTEKISTEGLWIHHSAMLGDQSDVLDVVAAVKKVLELL